MQSFNNFNLTEFNSYRICAVCKKAWFPKTENDFLKIFNQNSNKRIIILGNGNNIILRKEYYEEEFIILNSCFDNIKVINTEIEANAGATFLQLCQIALKHQLTGLEIFYDIPSSIGGAVVMNAGSKEGEIKDILVKVRYLDLVDMQIKEITKEDIGFEFRNSFFQKNIDKIVLKAWLLLQKGNQKTIIDKMENIKVQRWAKQPKDFPNAGSVFKRPKNYYVGTIIEELGLKGYTIGGAKVSEKHAGFIINFNNAKGQDIIDIITEIKRQVWNKYEFNLELEQRVI